MKLYLATDHAGFLLKEKIKTFLQEVGHDVTDCGAYASDADDDYPDFIHQAAVAVSADPSARAIILGSSGQGEAMAANRHPGVRAAVYYGGEKSIIPRCREHNDANVLSLGAQFLEETEAIEAVRIWLEAPFSNAARHVRRIGKL